MSRYCRSCEHFQTQDSIFCEQCGRILPPTLPEPPATEGAGPAGAKPPAPPPGLRVLILNTSQWTGWLNDAEIHIGRGDARLGIHPTLDLTEAGGQGAGVSRRHARISRQPDGYYLEDLGSINGTFINRRRLPPGAPVALGDRDEIRLGNVILRVILAPQGTVEVRA